MSGNLNVAAVDPEILRRVERATAVLRPMLPTMSAYVSAMVGRRMPVEIGPKTRTNVSRVEIAPPLQLADLGPHQVGVCGRRNEIGVLACPTCAGVEAVLMRLRHEISHHVWGSFNDSVPQYTRSGNVVRRTLYEALGKCPPPVAALGMLLEDVRIDRAACDADPAGAGAHYALHAQTLLEQDTGTEPISQAPLARRVMAALLTIGVGSDTLAWVGQDAADVLDDPVVDSLIGDDFEIGQIPEIAQKLFDRLVELGVFEEPEDMGGNAPAAPSDSSEDSGPDAEPEQDSGDADSSDTDNNPGDDNSDDTGGEQEGSSDGTSESGDEGGSDGDQSEAEAGDPDGQAGVHDSGGTQTPGGGDPGDDTDADAEGSQARAQDLARQIADAAGAFHCGEHDHGEDSEHPEQGEQDEQVAQAVEAMLEHVAQLGDLSGGVGRIHVYPPDEGQYMRRYEKQYERLGDAQLGGLVGRARRVFNDNRAVKRTKGQPRGRVEPTLLGKRAWNAEDNRVFGSRVRPTAPSYSVLIGMDDSYSTEMASLVELIRSCVDAMAQLCDRTGVEFGLYGHTTSEYNGRGLYDMQIYTLKEWGERYTPTVRARLGRLEPGNTNLDGSTMRLYRRHLSTRPSTRKILLYFTDGEIPGTGGEAEADIMRDEVDRCRRAGITLLGVGVRTRSPERFGIPTVSLDSAGDIGHVLEFLAKEFGA